MVLPASNCTNSPLFSAISISVVSTKCFRHGTHSSAILTIILPNLVKFLYSNFEISSFLYIVYESQQNKCSHVFPQVRMLNTCVRAGSCDMTKVTDGNRINSHLAIFLSCSSDFFSRKFRWLRIFS